MFTDNMIPKIKPGQLWEYFSHSETKRRDLDIVLAIDESTVTVLSVNIDPGAGDEPVDMNTVSDYSLEMFVAHIKDKNHRLING